MSPPPLRPYQTSAIDQARACIERGARAVLICMPTGTGKTRVAVEACLRHVNRGGVPLFVAPRRELLDQATRTFAATGLEPGHDCFIRSIQELTAKSAIIPRATLVVLDEARHYVADTWSSIRTALPSALLLGLDATPERGDGRGLGGMFDEIVQAISVSEAIEQGFLVPCEVLRPNRSLLTNELAQDPLDAYQAKAAGTSAVIFCRSVEDAKDLAERARARDIPAAAVWGDMPAARRDSAIDGFAMGEIKILTNLHLLTEGWDAPSTETVILGRHFPTPGGMLQAAGRGLRIHPGKRRCLVLDLVGCTHVHGEPDEPRAWHLHGRASTRVGTPDGDDVRFCPMCGGVAPAGSACPSCGFEGDERRRRKPRILGLPVERFARQRQETDEQKARKLAFYVHEARRAGHHVYSAHKRFESVYGHMPTPAIKRLALSTG